MKNKKGQFIDIMYIAYILLLLAVIGMIGAMIMNAYEEQITDDNLLDTENIQMVSDYNDKAVPMVDNLFLITLVGVSLIAVVSAFYVQSAPWFYFISAVVLGFLCWINSIYANVYQAIASSPDLLPYAEQYTFIPIVMRYFPLTMLVISFIIVIVQSSKR